MTYIMLISNSLNSYIIQQSHIISGNMSPVNKICHINKSRDELPSGKLSHNYGKSPCLLGKSTISMAMFKFANC